MKLSHEIAAAFLALILVILIIAPAAAEPVSPEALVKQVTGEVLDAIRKDKGLEAGDKRKALALAEEKILPHVDFAEATRLAVGRTWSQASPEQKEQLISAFRAMLVRIYSEAIDVYRGQTMRVLPTNAAPGVGDVIVRNQYVRPGEPPVVIEYAMRRTAGGWKIYDIAVAGVSLVLTYRAEFDQVTRTEGIEGLLKRLREKNRSRPSSMT